MPREPSPFDDLPDDLIEDLRKTNPPGPLTYEVVEELRQIIAQEHGVVLSQREAWGTAIELLSLVVMLLRHEGQSDGQTSGAIGSLS